jgi:hypothetical protein
MRYHLLAKLLQSLALGERYIYTFPSFLCSTLNQVPPFILSNLQMISSKDANFLGYTFKNLEIVDEHHIPGMAELKRKSKTANKPSLKTLFETPYPPSENQALKDLLDSPIYSEGSRGSSGSPFSRPNQSQARR